MWEEPPREIMRNEASLMSLASLRSSSGWSGLDMPLAVEIHEGVDRVSAVAAQAQ